jgi:FdhD protein
MEDNMSLIKEKEIIRVILDEPQRLIDKIIKEVPYQLNINGEDIVNFVCTPEFIEDLAIGYIYSQGLMNNIQQINSIELIKGNTINIILDQWIEQSFQKKIMTSGERSLEQVDEVFEVQDSNKFIEVITPTKIYALTNRLFDESTLHSETGGVHNAALSSFDEQFYEFRKDIGRHNAADKLIGYCLRNKILLEDKILVFSGRISSEIIKKVARAKIPMIVSVSAPTDLAVETAQSLNITLVGFVRGKKMNIYNDCNRIKLNW